VHARVVITAVQPKLTAFTPWVANNAESNSIRRRLFLSNLRLPTSADGLVRHGGYEEEGGVSGVEK